MIFWPISWEDWSRRTDKMGMKTPCLGTHSGSLNKTLVAYTHNLGASGDWVPVRQQHWLIMRNGIWQVLICFNWFCKCFAFVRPRLRKKFDCVDVQDCGNETQKCLLPNIVNWIINKIFYILRIFGLQVCRVMMPAQAKLLPVKS